MMDMMNTVRKDMRDMRSMINRTDIGDENTGDKDKLLSDMDMVMDDLDTVESDMKSMM